MKNKSAGFFEKDSTKSVISSLIAILIGLLVGLVIILIANPADALEGFLIMLTGGFQEGMLSLGDVLAYSVPVMMTGLSIAFAYKTGEFNIGVPGQYYVGAFVALLIGVKATFLPDAIAWLIAIICGGLAGALWAFVPGILKAKRNVNVVISGIMMNYVGLLLVIRGVKTFIYESTGAQSLTVSTERAIPKFGQLKATGFNKDAAKYAGMNETKAVIMSLVIAGLFAGVGGAIAYLGGTGKAIQISEVLPPEGFNGIPVALLGFSNPIGCIFASLFIAYINVGGNYMQSLNIAIEVIDIIVAVIVYFASFTLFIKLMLDKFRNSKKHKTLAAKEGGNK